MSTPVKAPITTDHLLGVVLAGGRSSRMGGGDKFLLPIAGTTMLELVLSRFKSQLKHIVISTNGDATRLKHFGAPITKDTIGEYEGPLAGILACFAWAKQHSPKTTHLLSIAADTPFFPENYTKAMLARANAIAPNSIILAKSQSHYHPIFGLWPLSLAQDLEKALKAGTRKIRAWTEQHNHDALMFDDILINSSTLDPFFNVNKPADFAQCKRFLSC